MHQAIALIDANLYIVQDVLVKVMAYHYLCQNILCQVNWLIYIWRMNILNRCLLKALIIICPMFLVLYIVRQNPLWQMNIEWHTGRNFLNACYIIGDYNANLLKYGHHPPTERCLNTMYSNSLMPMIFKSIRETKIAANPIDNIFTNKYSADDIFEGILVTDVSDHYVLFHISEKYCPELEYHMIRLVNELILEK